MASHHSHTHNHCACSSAKTSVHDSHSHDHTHEHDHGHGHSHGGHVSLGKRMIPMIISFVMLLAGLAAEHLVEAAFFKGTLRLIWYIAAYLPVAFPVIRESLESIRQKDFFNEFSLMAIATLGAFYIGEYPEAVAVMLFYSVGEMFQDLAVERAAGNIRALLDIRPDRATVIRDGDFVEVPPVEVSVGEVIMLKVGERVPLDGTMLSSYGSFDTSALTGESRPRKIEQGETVLSGMVNTDCVVELRVEREYENSAFSRILDMVRNATQRKSKTELLIRRFARIYTPVVFLLAVLIAFVPMFFVAGYEFNTWFYRALIFLVISCPCALVISVPLGYFGGIGAASRAGILFKGANYIDALTKVNTVVMDKTGTVTKGVFRVQKVVSDLIGETELVGIAASLEGQSNHPVARAVVAYAKSTGIAIYRVTDVKEISGYGMSGTVDGHETLAGNVKLMIREGIPVPDALSEIAETIVVVAVNKRYCGYIIIADEVKDEASRAIAMMRKNGVREVQILSGDRAGIVDDVAKTIGVDRAYGELLPEDKVKRIEDLKTDPTRVVAFVGDGINDAPSLALSDVGIVMGALGSDAAIEVADVVIQTDDLTKIPAAMRISRATHRIVIQNIVFALSVKLLVLVLGTVGIASMWSAVFADVGVALLAVVNSIRILKMKF